jgi:hypothetical protein
VSLACPVADRLYCDAGGTLAVRTPDPESSGVESGHWRGSGTLCSLTTDAEPAAPCQGRRTAGNVVVAACPLGADAYEFAGAYYGDTVVACSYRLAAAGVVGDLVFARVVADMPSTRQPKLISGPRFTPFGSGARCHLTRAEAAAVASPTGACGFFGTASQTFSVREVGNAVAQAPVHTPRAAYNIMRCPTASAIGEVDGRLRVHDTQRWGAWVEAEFDDAGMPYARVDWVTHGWPVIGRIYPVMRDGRTRAVCEYVAKPLPGAPPGLAPQRVGLEYAPPASVVVEPFNERRDACVLNPASSPHSVPAQCDCYAHGGVCEDGSVPGGVDYSFSTTGPEPEPGEAEPVACPPAGVILCDATRGFYMDVAGARVYASESIVSGAAPLPCWTPRAFGGMQLLHTTLELVSNFTRVSEWRCAYRIADETCFGAETTS